MPDTDFLARVDVVIALGGDGAMRLVIDRQVPALGVNRGNLGFLVEVAPDLLPSALERLVSGDLTLERVAWLETAADDDLATRFGFDDVALTTSLRPEAAQVACPSAKEDSSLSAVKLSLLDPPVRSRALQMSETRHVRGQGQGLPSRETCRGASLSGARSQHSK
ncbi:NAD(+)/NADH kinase [Actinocorallia herbida]|uniref:NAD(+)/NADH kinase n=1 Tax=Actinocorallia herbida TaxID=58109 RepID=UPI001FE75FB6|nr:NAD(+)/NADH kinase [Actinocorallia herbida]